MSGRIAKRQRTGKIPSFGAPNSSDINPTQQNNPSSSASSTRRLPSSTIPALITLCGRVFVTNFVKLRSNEIWEHKISNDLRAIPDAIIPKIFTMLRASCPTFLTHEFIVTYLLRGPSVTLRSDLPGVNRSTILSISRVNTGVHEIELSGFEKITDKDFASLLRHLPGLRVLVLRGCTKVGPETVIAVAKTCPSLRIANFNYTSVTPASLVSLITTCIHLEVLKLAGIQNWTDATFANLIAGVDSGIKLPALRTLKIRQTALSDVSLSFLLGLYPGLQRLDVSFTLIRRLSYAQVPPLQKLSLTSTAVPSPDLIQFLTLLPQLRVLHLGALGANRGSRISVGNSSAMTINDQTLYALTAVLQHLNLLEDISLVGNTKLGTTSKGNGALFEFISLVGRKCKKLNLAGIPSAYSSDLSGLMPSDINTGISPLETLILSNTGIGDEAGSYISTCASLRLLDVSGTRITREGLFSIINSCQMLESLNLTSCRGINVVDRRRFFAVWEEANDITGEI